MWPTSQLLYGSDVPFGSHTSVLAGLGKLGLPAADAQAIERENALRLFPRVMVVLDAKGNRLKPQKTIDRAQIKRTLEKGSVAIDASEFFL